MTVTLVIGVCLAFAYATYLSYNGSSGLQYAYNYRNTVLSALNATSELQVQTQDRGLSGLDAEPYVEILRSALDRVDRDAERPDERAPVYRSDTRAALQDLTNELLKRGSIGDAAFSDIVARNKQTRDFSNVMFAVVALLFAVLVGRLRRTIEERQSIVERLQRAFISTRRTIPNVDLGSVLISATRGSNVGGDTFDAFSFDGKHGLFLVADVSGKGIDAAVDTALIKYTMRTLFSEHSDPGAMLDRFGAIYTRTAENPETFVVLFVAIVDLEDGTVRYASAGHEPAWAVRAGVVESLPATGSIVGIGIVEPYLTRTFALEPGDALVVSTDGLTESRDARGNLLGADAVRVWLAELQGPAQAMADAVVRRLRKRSKEITDDLAIVVVRYQPAARAGRTEETVPALVSDR